MPKPGAGGQTRKPGTLPGFSLGAVAATTYRAALFLSLAICSLSLAICFRRFDSARSSRGDLFLEPLGRAMYISNPN
jgi:hypothetical protein